MCCSGVRFPEQGPEEGRAVSGGSETLDGEGNRKDYSS